MTNTINELVQKLDNHTVGNTCAELLQMGADVQALLDKMSDWAISQHLSDLLKAGVPVNTLVDRMTPQQVYDHREFLLQHGADEHIVNQKGRPTLPGWLINRIYLNPQFAPSEWAPMKTILHGANRRLVSQHSNFTDLLFEGADPDILVKKASPDLIEAYADELLERGANPELVARAIDRFCRGCVADHLAALLQHGANPNAMMRYMYTQQIVEEMDLLQRYGADLEAVAMRRAKSGRQIEGDTDSLAILLVHSGYSPKQIAEII